MELTFWSNINLIKNKIVSLIHSLLSNKFMTYKFWVFYHKHHHDAIHVVATKEIHRPLTIPMNVGFCLCRFQCWPFAIGLVPCRTRNNRSVCCVFLSPSSMGSWHGSLSWVPFVHSVANRPLSPDNRCPLYRMTLVPCRLDHIAS